jgi:hypothetical protein
LNAVVGTSLAKRAAKRIAQNQQMKFSDGSWVKCISSMRRITMREKGKLSKLSRREPRIRHANTISAVTPLAA